MNPVERYRTGGKILLRSRHFPVNPDRHTNRYPAVPAREIITWFTRAYGREYKLSKVRYTRTLRLYPLSLSLTQGGHASIFRDT
jgi:hypothetical protein